MAAIPAAINGSRFDAPTSRSESQNRATHQASHGMTCFTRRVSPLDDNANLRLRPRQLNRLDRPARSATPSGVYSAITPEELVDGTAEAARVVAGDAAAPRGRPARRRQGGAIAALAEARAADRRGRARRPLDLPLLRGRLRTARLRQGRRGHAHRGRPGEPDLTWPALPERPGVEELRAESVARIQGQVP